MKLSAAQTKGLEEIRARLRAVDESGTSVLEWVTAQMQKILCADAAGVYAVEDTVSGPRLAFGIWCGLPLSSDRVNQHLDAALGRSGQFAAFDATRPSMQQRNRVVIFPTTRQVIDGKHVPVRPLREEERRQTVERVRRHSEFFAKVGVLELQHQRILICDGPRLLAWFGVLDRQDCTPERRRLLQQLASMVKPRLRFERERNRAGLAYAALDVALEAIGAPALVISARDSVVHANTAGREVLDHERERIADLLSRSSDGVAESADVYDLGTRGQPGSRLVVLRSRGALAVSRRRAAIDLWQLTPREAQVLELLITGDTNRDMAITLGCAEATIEIHVSRLLRKAGVDTRTALVSAYWNTGAPI